MNVPMALVPGDSDGLFVHFGEQVTAEIIGLPLGQTVMSLVRVADYIDSVEEARRI